ncbi:MAG: hypothetical protein QMC93_00040 [Patescibacteria group bacterium]|nr:hypothetical protein [Patescibacteria group bacterium]
MSKVFEFYFNPCLRPSGFGGQAGGQANLKKDTIFETFCFTPENKSEEKLGSLYLVGELKNILAQPKPEPFLKNVAEIIKNEYYRSPQREAEDAFREGLVKANEFLQNEIKNENTNWLGNLNFAVLSLLQDFSIYLSAVGKLKVLLQREGELFTLLENQNTGALSRIFPSLTTGQLKENDKIFVLSRELFEIFVREKILENLAQAKKKREIKNAFKEKKGILKEIFGVCLLVVLKKKGILKKELYLPKISFSPYWQEFLSQRVKFFQKVLPQSPPLHQKLKKSLISLLVLSLLLLLGYLIFQ